MSTQNETTADYVIEFNRISKWFLGVKALNEVSFAVRRGSVHALVGENGAGKSTLMKVLNGTYKADVGEVLFNGKPLMLSSSMEAIKRGISMIYQELNLCNDLTVAENIYMNKLPKKMGRIDWSSVYSGARKLLAEYSLDIDAKAEVEKLTISQMQMVEIIKALSNNSEVIIMDEPTSAITDTEVEILFSFIRKCRAERKTIIYISHRIHEILEIADDVTILRDGNYMWTKPAAEITQEEIIKAMVGRQLAQMYPKLDAEIGDTVLEVRGLCRENVFKNINFFVRKGEILGIAGLMGSKRTETVRAIYGLERITSGEIWTNGQLVRINNVTDAIKNGILMVSEDRKRYGLVLMRSLKENVTLSSLSEICTKLGFIKKKTETERATEYVTKLQVKYDSLAAPVNNLSGGNQQKTILAKCLMAQPRILILDEPTRGIDVGSKSEIHRLIGECAQHGLAVIVISSELPELMRISDRIVVLHEGRQKGTLNRNEFSQEAIMELVYKEV